MLLQTCLFALVCISQLLYVKASKDSFVGGLIDDIEGLLDDLKDKFKFPFPQKDKIWDGLVVKWGSPRVPDSEAFKALPRTAEEASKENWVELDNGCKDKALGFLGRRFILNNQSDILIILDRNGYIAGVQMAVDKDTFDQNGVLDPKTYPPIFHNTIQGKDVYVITAYFVLLEKICRGRTAHEFKTQGTGTVLSFFNGTDTLTNPVYQPRTLTKRLSELGWMREKCVPTMGQHYFNDFRPEKDCAEISPFALLFDNRVNTMVGFNTFVFGPHLSKRFEYPPKESILMFADPLPNCYMDAIDKARGMSSVHFWFTSNPQGITCP